MKPETAVPVSPMKSSTQASNPSQGNLVKPASAIIRVASLLLLAAWASGQMAQAQIPALRLQAANYNATSGLWTNTVGPNAQAGGTFPTLSTGVSPNGSAAVVFNGANYLTLASSIPSGTPYTIFAYIKPATGAGPYALFGGAAGSFEYRINGGKQNDLRRSQADLGSETTAMSTSAFSVINTILTGTGNSFRLNGAADGTNTANSALTQPVSAVGAGGSGTGNENFSGSICEIAIFTNVLTAVQITNIEKALTATYVSSISAPVVFSDTTASSSTVMVGGSASFYASFAGSSPISYQWQFSTNSSGSGAVNIAGATNNTLSLVNLQSTNAGYYSLQATNTVSPFSANSSWVQLTVQPLTALVQYQSTNYNATSGVWTDSSGNGNNATYSGGTKPTLVSVATPNGSPTLSFTAVNQYFSLASSLSAGSGYTVFAYVKPNSSTGSRFALTGGSAGGNALEYDLFNNKQNYLVEFVSDKGSGTATIPTSSFSLINLAVNSSGAAFRLNGASDGTQGGATFSQPITRLGGNTGAGDNFIGQVVEIDIYSGVLTPYQITNVEAQLTARYITANSVVVGPATVSPTNNIYAGTSVTLAASVIGATGTTGYQWQTDNGSGGASYANISGATTTNYALTTTSLTPNTYQYQLVVTPFGGGAVTSAPVTLTVQAASAPVVVADTTANPSVAAVGGNDTLTATFNGTLPIGGYQWQIANNSSGTGATSLTGQTNTTLVLTNLQLNDSGKYYSLRVTNNVSPYAANSTWLQLAVVPLTPAVQLLATNYDAGSGVWTDSTTNNNNATYSGTQNPTQVNFATPNGSSAVNIFTNDGSFVLAAPLAQSNGYTVFTYIMPTNTSGRRAIIGGSASDALEYDIYNGKQNYLREYNQDVGSGATNVPTMSFSLLDLAVNASGAAFRYNGVADGTNVAGATFTQPITRIGNNHGGGDGLVGKIAEVDIYSGVLTFTQITNVEAQLTAKYIAANTIVVFPATVSPTNNTYADNSVTLAAPVVGGSGSTAYQWQADSGSGYANISGATTTNYVLNTTGLLGTYQLQLIGTPFGGSSVTSAPVTLTVQAASAPVVITDTTPNPAAATVGGNLTFSAGFAGNSTIRYQWQISPNADGSGATSLTTQTNTTLVLANLQLSDSGKYYSLQASNAIAPYTNNSSWAQLTVSPLSPVLQLKAANYNPSSGLWTATIGANAQATGTYPTLATGVTSNGSPAVVFNGANKLQLATSIPATNAYTVFAYTMPSTYTGNLALIGGATGAFEYRISSGKQDALKQATTDLGSSTTALSTNAFNLIDATVSGSGGAFRLNGVADGTNAVSSFTADISSIGARDTGTGENFSGQIVEIDIYNGVLSPTQISTIETALTNAYFNPLAPAVVTDTAASPSTATISGNDTLSASFSGNLPIGYQWQVANNSSGTGATSLTGQTNTTLVLTNLQLTDSGKYYSLRATNTVSPYTANSSWLQLNVVALTPALQLLATNYDAGSGVWTDSSGSGNNATYSGGTTPTLVTSVTPNGGSAVNISSTGGSFVLTSGLSQTNGGYTVFAYVMPTTVNSGSARFAITGGSAAGALEYNFYQGNQNYLIEYTGGGGGGTATIPTSTFSMVSLAVNASGANFRLNGADDGTVAGATFTQPITRIGNNHGFGDSLVGQVAEVDVYNGVLTTTQITNIEAQLTAKYITSTVATNPTNITASVFGNTLTLTWPGDHLGWTLQTNALDLANTNDWFAYPGSATVTNVNITMNPSLTNVFFRLISP